MQHALTVLFIDSTMEWKTNRRNKTKEKAPLGKAVTGLWSYLTCLQRDWLWCWENSSQTVTYSPENNCQTCSRAHWLPRRQHRHELLFFFVLNVLLFYKLICLASWVLLHDMPWWEEHFEHLNAVYNLHLTVLLGYIFLFLFFLLVYNNAHTEQVQRAIIAL